MKPVTIGAGTSGAHPEALLMHPSFDIRRFVPQGISPSSSLCIFEVGMNESMRPGPLEEVLRDVSSALKRDDGVLLHEAGG